MEFSTFLVFAAWTASMTYLTFGKERERAMLFPDYYFLAERRLVNHAIEEKRVKNLDDCELMCYLNDSCMSLNFKKDPDNNQPGHICELNNVTHLKYDSDLTTDANFYYRGSKSACDKSSHCQNNATCQSGFTLKGYRCLCPPGFEGESCETDTDECEVTPGKCHEEATCNNTNGSYVCICKPGFIGDGHGRNCTDFDECKGNHSCHENANCRNTIGSHECDCQPGYTGNGKNCTDIDECITYPGKCHVNATCNNTDGSHVCSCKPGYIGDGRSCTDVDECKGKQSCHEKAKCTNTIGSHVCECQPGYTGNGQNCTDIDECSNARADQLNKCHANASCISTYGSYNCSCNPKYIGDGFNCEVDPCYDYKNLSDASRKSSYTDDEHLCDKKLPEGWYRFVGAAGTKMPTTRVPAFSCGTVFSGWLMREDAPPSRKVCFSDKESRCEDIVSISEKECGSYHIYKLYATTECPRHYCGSD